MTSDPAQDDERKGVHDLRRGECNPSSSLWFARVSDAYVIDALRTPIGRYGGALANARPDDLAAHVIARRGRAQRPARRCRSTRSYMGCTNQAGEDNRNVARMGLLLAGLPVEVPGVTVNRLCASGLEAVNQGARQIMLGDGRPGAGRRRRVDDPRAARDGRSPTARSRAANRHAVRHDDRVALREPAHGRSSTRPRRWARRPRTSPSATASAAPTRTSSRSRATAARWRPPRRAASTRRSCRCPSRSRRATRSPCTPTRARGRTRRWRSSRACGRRSARAARVTAGNSSQHQRRRRVPGAGDAERAPSELGREPLARIVSIGAAGVDPRLHGHRPGAGHAQGARARPASTADDIDLVELNEAFAAQVLACDGRARDRRTSG